MYTFGFIGTGSMGLAMLKGCLSEFAPEELAFTRRDKIKGQELSGETGTAFLDTSAECAAKSHVIILAVKPQVYPEVLPEIRDKICDDSIVISLAPSYSIASLKEQLGENARIVRAMPNTPASIGEGMTGISLSGDNYSDEDMKLLERFFTSFGMMEIVPENLMDTVTAASGSSPAFVYMMIEALADGAVAYGMPRSQAYKFVAQTVCGAAKMVLETGEHPGKLKDDVCSPGGTTIAAVASLEKNGFRNSLIEAAAAVCERCRNM